jgi:hypothetical protein
MKEHQYIAACQTGKNQLGEDQVFEVLAEVFPGGTALTFLALPNRQVVISVPSAGVTADYLGSANTQEAAIIAAYDALKLGEVK